MIRVGRPNLGKTGIVMRVHPHFRKLLDEKINNGEGKSYSEITKQFAEEEKNRELRAFRIISENTQKFMKGMS